MVVDDTTSSTDCDLGAWVVMDEEIHPSNSSTPISVSEKKLSE